MLIDIHTHTRIPILGSKSQRAIGVKQLLEYIDKINIDKAVVLAAENWDLTSKGEAILSEEVLEACRKHPDRLIPFCCVDPREPNAVEKVKEYVQSGCKGFGEHKVNLPVDDFHSENIYHLCGQLKIPLLIHIDQQFGGYNLDTYIFEKVVRKFPDTVFIAHAGGWWANISKVVDDSTYYPKGRIEGGGLVDKILQGYPNVYADISAYSGLNAFLRDMEFSKKFVRRNWKKILFGTDFPCLDSNGEYFGTNRQHLNLLKQLDLDKEMYQSIIGENARRLLGI